MEVPESQNSRDSRIEKLWQRLDPQKKGELDFNGLRQGLSRIDHPLKNAEGMLKDVVKAMDKNGDQIISYEEFRTFVENTEKELLILFKSIDRDHNGKLDKDELRAAFKREGVAVSDTKLDKFFAKVDQNHDGYITFSEWRSFLLFIETPELKNILSYYSSAISLNSEGDTSISEETLEGLGRARFSFTSAIFGVISQISSRPKPDSQTGGSSRDDDNPRSISKPTTELQKLDPELVVTSNNAILQSMQPRLAETTSANELEALQTASQITPTVPTSQQESFEQVSVQEDSTFKKSFLAEITPDPGYFAAGGIAGAISRTCTAPLDRLKVYLIANTGPAKDSFNAAVKGDAVAAARKIGTPLINATKELWRAGGVRSLFAGNGLNVVKVMPESAIKFGSYEAAKRALAQLEGHGDPQNINPYSQFLAGGVGGMVSQLFVYPIDTLKFRMQCETVEGGLHGNALIVETAKKMYKQGGIRSSYRGLTMGLVGMFPYSAIDLGTFEFLKAAIAARKSSMGYSKEDSAPGSFATGCIGAFSGAFGASVVYPINLLRTRLQAQGTVLHPPTYDGIIDVAQKTFKNEGFRGLFKGITPNLLKVVPAVSITYVVYEKSKKVLHLET